LDGDVTLEATLINVTQVPVTPVRSPLPRSRRQPFEPTGNFDSTPKAATADVPKVPGSVEPLSIKKRTSVRTNATTSPTLAKKSHIATRGSPKNKSTAQSGSPRKTTTQTRSSRIPVSQGVTQLSSATAEDAARLIRLFETTKEDVESSRRSIKRIRLETEKLRSGISTMGTPEEDRPASPFKGFRNPMRTTAPLTKEAQARMEEMRQLIGKRNVEGTPRSRTQSALSSAGSSSSISRLSNTPPHTPLKVNDISRNIDELVDRADSDLVKVANSQETFKSDLETLVTQYHAKSSDLDKTRFELQNTKRQFELVKSLLDDCTAEKEIIIQAFNEELDGMYNDINLPDDEAWAALTKDLRKTKEDRNALSHENSHLKRRLEEVEMQKEEWGALLRAHGLIP